MNLHNKTALITGATSGIGLTIAQGFAMRGVHIAFNGFVAHTPIGEIIADLEQHGVAALYSDIDMRDVTAINDMIDTVTKRFGGIDILVNNAGIQHVAPIEQFPPQMWETILSVNLSAAFHTTRLAIPFMQSHGWGRIINIASTHGLVASPMKSAYVAAKHGLIGLTKTVALELAEQNITCNAICPGYVRTPLVERQIPDTARTRGISEEDVIREVMLKQQATKRFVEPDEVMEMAVYLCGEAARNITGSCLLLDGGWLAQ